MFTKTQKSFYSKPKRGLSLSLQKIKKNQPDLTNQEPSKQLFTSDKGTQSIHNSANKKNRIKFVEGYKQSKLDRNNNQQEKYLKNTNQNIQLGGKKKSNSFVNRINFKSHPTDYFLRIPTLEPCFIRQQYSTFQSDKKFFRQSRVSNLHSNINYFQQRKLIEPGESFFGTALSTIDLTSNLPLKPVKGKQQLLNQASKNSKIAQKKVENEVTILIRQQFCEYDKQNIELIKNQEVLKSSTLQKLKQVESKLDRLLNKANKTKQLILNN